MVASLEGQNVHFGSGPRPQGRPEEEIPFSMVLLAPILGLVPVGLMLLGVKAVGLAYGFLSSAARLLIRDHKFEIFAVGCVLSVALFLFKKYVQFWYGFLELFSAMIAMGAFIAPLPNDASTSMSWATAFLGPVYIAVRGFTNMDEARRKVRERIAKTVEISHAHTEGDVKGVGEAVSLP